MFDATSARAEIEKIIRSMQNVRAGGFFAEFMERSGIAIVSEAKQKAPVDRGSLRRAITHRVTDRPLRLDVGVLGGAAKGVPYAAIQEIGGTITIQKRQWLTIPLETRYRDKSPRGFDLFFDTIGGKRFLMDRSTGKAAYVLVKSVTIRAQPYLTPAINNYMQTKFNRLMNKMLDEYLGA